MNAHEIETLRNTMQLTDLNPALDFRNIVGGMVVLFKGIERGSVSSKKYDRNYTIAVRNSGHERCCDTLGEAVLYLVPELAEIEAR